MARETAGTMKGGCASRCSTPLMKSLQLSGAISAPLAWKFTWTVSPVQFRMPFGSSGFGMVPLTTGVPVGTTTARAMPRARGV